MANYFTLTLDTIRPTLSIVAPQYTSSTVYMDNHLILFRPTTKKTHIRPAERGTDMRLFLYRLSYCKDSALICADRRHEFGKEEKIGVPVFKEEHTKNQMVSGCVALERSYEIVNFNAHYGGRKHF